MNCQVENRLKLCSFAAVGALIACVWCTSALAVEKVEKADKADVKKAGAKADVKAEVKGAAKVADDPLAEARKLYPGVAGIRKQAEKLHEEMVKLEAGTTPAEQKKAERSMPKKRDALEKLQDKIMAELEKAEKPIQKDIDKLTDKEGKLITQIGQIESKPGGKADKQNEEMKKIGAEKEKLEKQMELLRNLADIESMFKEK